MSQLQWRLRREAQGLPRRSERELASRKRLWKERSEPLVQYLNDYKIRKGCADCGYNAHPIALDCDHLPGADKYNLVGRLARLGRRDRFWEELPKCEVVCANCHRIRTLERGQYIRKRSEDCPQSV